MWFGDLVDVKQFQSDSDGMVLHIRVSASETELKEKVKVKLVIILATLAMQGQIDVDYCNKLAPRCDCLVTKAISDESMGTGGDSQSRVCFRSYSLASWLPISLRDDRRMTVSLECN
ncbi:hypothetical protein V6N11_068988 [Hibiscus sabdariffa]|uniref:Uncharacterized protein n=2 Tax=Hibiscus sabdariffa TaxID=183260 RepID=A0ABR2PBC5_9ROSI